MSYAAARTEGRPGAPLVFTFHGTGGTEQQFHSTASRLVPGARVVSPRGDVDERGALRFFRRQAEGIYDLDDLARRTAAMTAFLRAEIEAARASDVAALGYSNGANILASVSFGAPDLAGRIALLHPLIPFTPEPQPGLTGRSVLITAGRRDPICPPDATERLADWYAAQGARTELVWHAGGHEIAPQEIEALRGFLA